MKSLDALKELGGNISTTHSSAYYHSKQWKDGGTWVLWAFLSLALCIVIGVVFSVEQFIRMPSWIPLAGMFLIGIAFAVLLLWGARVSSQKWYQMVEGDVLYRRARLIQNSERAFRERIAFYNQWFEVASMGGSIDEAKADAFFAFLEKAKRSILLAEANFKLAMKQIELNKASSNLTDLQELINVLGEGTGDSSSFISPIVSDKEEGELQKTLDILSLGFRAQQA